jgi:YidC/Oxa1 family membrane protein insertase
MNDSKRFLLFFLLAVLVTTGSQVLFTYLGLIPRAARPQPAAVAQNEEPKAKAEKPEAVPGPNDKPKGPVQAEAPAAAAQPASIAVVAPGELLLGSATDKTPGGYKMALQLEQKGAGVASLALSRFAAEFAGGKPRGKPLMLIQSDRLAPPSFAMTLESMLEPGQQVDPKQPQGSRLEFETWEVVRDANGRAIHPITKANRATRAPVEGQEVMFRTTAGNPPVTFTKRFRLWKGEDGFELELDFESAGAERTLVYELMGPHGLPIEGESYTPTFRDAFISQKGIEIRTRQAQDVVKRQADPERFSTSPLLYAGVENQYFAVFLEPTPPPTSNDNSKVKETVATVIHEVPAEPQKSDLSVQLTSKPVQVGPNRSASQSFRVYAGPKRVRELAGFGAEELATYRRTGWFYIPLASTLAQTVISPLLERIYSFTAWVAAQFGGKRGSYGIAIILLTITVRLLMFPLSRKQALSAKKMQDLQPLLVELKEKCKDDKEKLGKETLALYGKHGVNPVGGCLPALIQLPIFVGLWQALNNSVDLRHAPFLWIDDLAAPDMLFRFPMKLPLLGEYFNLLPLLVVGLMLVQTKLFSPPPTTPEAEMQMKTMKIMMIVMAFMFYWVPSGLGIYFITSSLWAVSERLLLPKLTGRGGLPAFAANRGDTGGTDSSPPAGQGAKLPKGGAGGNGAPKGWWAEHRAKLERLLDEASKDGTYRHEEREKPKDKPRARPGKRR